MRAVILNAVMFAVLLGIFALDVASGVSLPALIWIGGCLVLVFACLIISIVLEVI